MARKKTAIVSVTNDLFTDNRVDKICHFLEQQGYDVTLVGRQKKDSVALKPRSYKTVRMRLLAEKGPLFYASFSFRLFLFLLFKRADLLVSNDLDTLMANYSASKFKSNTRLVYDSHEYFTEVPELINRPSVQKFWEGIEHWIFPKLSTIYTVNASIAELYSKKYSKKVSVVRNIAPKWNSEISATKKELSIPEDTFLVILQGAGINIDRGAEEAVEAMKLLQNVTLLIVGDGDVIPELKKRVIDYDLQKSVLFFGKRPYNEMMLFTHFADIGLTLDKPTNLNYRYSLPNKVFDYLHANTPIICTKLIEVERIVLKHNIGLVLPELSPEKLAETISELQKNPALLSEFKENCTLAARTENWEMERKILEEIYPKVD
jgi:glycosyltransferase involved in cell wall biosynthesis